MFANKFNAKFTILKISDKGEGFAVASHSSVYEDVWGYLAKVSTNRYYDESVKLKTKYTHKLYIADELVLNESEKYLIRVTETLVDDKLLGDFVATAIDTNPNNKSSNITINLDRQEKYASNIQANKS